jgi:hypothetical protein
MKNIISLLVVIGTLVLTCGCDCTPASMRRRVELAFPDSQICEIPGNSNEWVVRAQDGSVWYVSFSCVDGPLNTNLFFNATK